MRIQEQCVRVVTKEAGMTKVGDIFVSRDGRVFEVTRTLPGGNVEMIDRWNGKKGQTAFQELLLEECRGDFGLQH